MLKCVIYWIYVTVLLTVVHSQITNTTDDTSSPSSSPVTTPSTISSSASSSESTTASTASPTTLSTSPSESTSASTASTGSSTSTTASSPTESTTVSTVQPITSSSTVGPVTTPVPIPPKPQKGSWNVTNNGTACIRAEMAALFTIPLMNVNRTLYIALSPNASDEDSNCLPPNKNDTQILVLTDVDYVFTMEFGTDDKQVFVQELSLKYNIEGFEGSVHTNSSKFFAVKKGNSYLCNSKKDISIENVTVSLSNLHIQAFGKKENTGFTVAEECDADDDVSQIVPIAVGCALAALVIIVLIAYLVGRRRNRQKGYQSV